VRPRRAVYEPLVHVNDNQRFMSVPTGACRLRALVCSDVRLFE
jgi:hypothetical protein